MKPEEKGMRKEPERGQKVTSILISETLPVLPAKLVKHILKGIMWTWWSSCKTSWKQRGGSTYWRESVGRAITARG